MVVRATASAAVLLYTLVFHEALDADLIFVDYHELVVPLYFLC